MHSKKYADSDFFLALLKGSDWLKEKAKKIYEQNKKSIYVSPFTVVEVMIICTRTNIPLKETLFQMSRIAELTSVDWNLFFKASEYIEKGASIFDSLLMAFCKENEIISSDRVYEKFGFKVIDLKK